MTRCPQNALKIKTIIECPNAEEEVEDEDGDSQGIEIVLEYLMLTEAEKRAKKNYRLSHPDKIKKYLKWYYLNVTKQKRAMKRAALRNHQAS